MPIVTNLWPMLMLHSTHACMTYHYCCCAAVQVHKLPTMFFIGPHADKPAAHYTGLLPEAVLRDMVQNRRQYLGTNIRKAVSV